MFSGNKPRDTTGLGGIITNRNDTKVKPVRIDDLNTSSPIQNRIILDEEFQAVEYKDDNQSTSPVMFNFFPNFSDSPVSPHESNSINDSRSRFFNQSLSIS